jgi:TRAP-type C4-dicarboxylate transport system permease small subunit
MGAEPAPLHALERARRLSERLAHGMTAVAGWVLLACAVFVTFDVLARNFLGFNSKATVEITSYCLAFGIAWGLAGAFVARAHVRIDVFIQRLPEGIRGYLHAAAVVAMAVFAGFLAYGAWLIVDESWAFGSTDISVLRTPLWIPQGLWAFGILMFTALVVVDAIIVLWLLARGRANEVEAMLRPRSYEEEAAEALEAVGYGPEAEKRR